MVVVSGRKMRVKPLPRYQCRRVIRYSPPIPTAAHRRAFDFNGNHIVIDFINTVNGRPVYTRDDLATIDDIFEWASAAGMTRGDGQLRRTAGESTQFAAAVALRESLYGVFGPVANGGSPEPCALEFVARRASLATRSAQWVSLESSFVPRWPDGSLESICDHLADAAIQLLRSPAVARVGSCAGCGWLFVDTSRGHARRWCSMNVCGVRDKMRRYHQRQTNQTSVT